MTPTDKETYSPPGLSHLAVMQLRSTAQEPRELRAAARRYRDRRIPSDVILLERAGDDAHEDWDEEEIAYTRELAAEMRYVLQEADSAALAPEAIAERSGAGRPSPEELSRMIERCIFRRACVLRFSGRNALPELWEYERPVMERLQHLLELRMQLLPQLETQAILAGRTNASWYTEEEIAGRRIARIGGDLVAVERGSEAPTSRETVVLPEGRWIHYWTDTPVRGGEEKEVTAPEGWPPFFVREGRVLAMDPVRQYSAEQVPAVTFLDIFPGRKITGELLERPRAGKVSGEARTQFEGECRFGRLRVEIGATEGGWQPERTMWVARIHNLPGYFRGATVDGRPAETGRADRVLEMSFPATGKKQLLEVLYHE